MKLNNSIISELYANKGTLTFKKPASRLELIIRLFYTVFLGIVYTVYSIGYSIILLVLGFLLGLINVFNWWYILFFGKRLKFAFEFAQDYLYEYKVRYTLTLFNYWLRYAPYAMLMTDERPSLGMHDSNTNYFRKL